MIKLIQSARMTSLPEASVRGPGVNSSLGWVAGPAVRRGKRQESGFVLLSVLFLVALIVLALTVAAPRIADEIRRDRENELYHRGMQYRRAIQLYHRRLGGYPSSIEQLEKTNNLRFLRKRYPDPITGKDEWHLIHLGQAKLPAMGFFGQPLTAGVPVAAMGSATGSLPSLDGGSSAFGGTGGKPPGADSGSTPGGSPDSPKPTDPASPGSSSTSPLSGGGPIVGVSSTSKKESIREYRKQTHYNDWEFVYDPSQERNSLGGFEGSRGTGGVPNSPGVGPVPPQTGPNPGPGQLPPGQGPAPPAGDPNGPGPGGGAPQPPPGTPQQ